MTKNMEGKFESREYWEARHKEGWDTDEEGNRKEPEPRFLAFLEKYKDKIGPRVLDIGCGPGRHLLVAAEKGYEVTGMDFSMEALQEVRSRIEEKGLHATETQADFHKGFPLADSSYDTEYSTQALNRNDWEGAKHVFAEIARTLKSDGLFFLRVRSSSRIPEDKPEKKIKINIIKEPIIDPEIPVEKRGITYVEIREGQGSDVKHAYSLEELVALGKKYGLEMIDVPVDEKEPGVPGQWNVIYRKVS